MGVGTVYNHFEQKEDVLRALLDERTEAMLLSVLPRPGEPEEFEARLKARMTRLMEYVDQHRDYFKLFMVFGMMPEAADDSMRKVAGSALKRVEVVRRTFGALVQEGIDAGALRPLEPAYLSAFLGGAIRSITFRGIGEKRPSLLPCAEEITELFLHGAASH
ncbi:MAG TPA: hypothetical protein VMV18_06545, partial [bacterium]|nr:hypothetical protein [bacterium]